ncbi:cytochrome c-type biogenesis protein [Saccharopolyspora sp. ID03-671]|uniref:cytochrome c-type biogenesis protein n=1 Tax=Saccharopolyspora sp. ID03-671 TaxID=3073066 RepID=UPI00324C2DAC
MIELRNRYIQALIGGAILALLAITIIGLMTGGPAQSDRAYELEQKLRCPVCKSVSVAESMSDTAQSMRRVVQEQVAAGRSDQEIIDYFRARYGDWVVLEPPASGNTLLVWAIPAVIGVVGALVVVTRTRPSSMAAAELTDEDRQRVEAALQEFPAGAKRDDEP